MRFLHDQLIVTTSKALVTRSDALVPSSLLVPSLKMIETFAAEHTGCSCGSPRSPGHQGMQRGIK